MLGQLCQNMYVILIALSIISLYCLCLLTYVSHTAQGQNATNPVPLLRDSNLEVELVAKHFDFPSAIDFLGNDDILLSEKNTGNVYEVINGNVTSALVHIDVGIKDERGLLGIATL